ncbi:MAG: DUF3656 domain-containing protein, partial [Clostridia bacterium]|nr:DUF3656 domain-containing protein [Clostridia bacterium]
GDGHSVTVRGEAAQDAIHMPTTAEKAIAALCKTGGTPYLATATAHIGTHAMLPASVINALRRDALDALNAERATIPTRRIQDAPPAAVKVNAFTYKRVLRLQTAQQYSNALCEETIVLPLSTHPDDLKRILETHNGICGIEIPRSVFGNTQWIYTRLQQAKAIGIRFVLCNNINSIEMARSCDLDIIGGFGCNITNSDAVNFYADNGFSALTLSPELSFPQMQFTKNAAIPCGIFIYGRLPLMLTRNCPRIAAGGRCDTCKGSCLVDRKQVSFPLLCENGCTEVLNSVPTYWGDCLEDTPSSLFHLYHFTIETAAEVSHIVSLYDNGDTPPFDITRGLYRKGVE